MAGIDYRIVYDMILHSWISERLQVFRVAENTKNFLVNRMNKWKLQSVTKYLRLTLVSM